MSSTVCQLRPHLCGRHQLGDPREIWEFEGESKEGARLDHLRGAVSDAGLAPSLVDTWLCSLTQANQWRYTSPTGDSFRSITSVLRFLAHPNVPDERTSPTGHPSRRPSRGGKMLRTDRVRSDKAQPGMLPDKALPGSTWVACERCLKWRRVSDASKLPTEWYPDLLNQ